MYPVIVCIAKKEQDYIEEFVIYHLHLGFKHIYIYDNEDIPTYEKLLQAYKENITVIHLPFNNYNIGVQYLALQDFITKHLCNTKITHVAHIDVDEFIVLKKHTNICEFIKEYIVGDCQGIGMNWRFFGSSGRTEQTNEPLTIRFTMCEKNGNTHIKTIFKKDKFLRFSTCHNVKLSEGNIKSTSNNILHGPFNENIDFSVIQLNHYKCKTLPEFRYIRTRQMADIPESKQEKENVEQNFHLFDRNEIEEPTACNYYTNIIAGKSQSNNQLDNKILT